MAQVDHKFEMMLAENPDLKKEDFSDQIASEKLEFSYAGHIGKFIEPAIRPLGFDWKIGIASQSHPLPHEKYL